MAAGVKGASSAQKKPAAQEETGQKAAELLLAILEELKASRAGVGSPTQATGASPCHPRQAGRNRGKLCSRNGRGCKAAAPDDTSRGGARNGIDHLRLLRH